MIYTTQVFHGPILAYPDSSQFRIFDKHAEHVPYICSIEVAQVNSSQFGIAEHVLHRCDLAGVQILYSFNGCQIFQIKEPSVSTCRAGSGKRRIEHHLRDSFIAVPIWIDSIYISRYVVFDTRLLGRIAIGIECEGVA